MKIRSITVFTAATDPLDSAWFAELGSFSLAARQAYTEAGFEVQTTRLALDGVPVRLADPVAFAVAAETLARDCGFEYVALGPAGIEMLPRLPAMFAATHAVFATAHIVNPASGAVDGAVARMAARVIHEASRIEDGFGNLRFAALANVLPGTPFFPAAYHGGGAPAFAVATEAADLAVAVGQAADLAEAHLRLRQAIEAEAARIVQVAERLAAAHGVRFGGIDFSLAPFPTPECSIGAALEGLTGQPLGAAGTLAAAATLADAIGQARFPHIGFCGLMLPVLEDAVLAQRAAEGRLHVGELLQWSAVCGTGLDTVPLPGDASEEALARLLFDVAALSVRLHKPLTARLMPLPGKLAGDTVHFDFAFFADGGVLPLLGDAREGLLDRTLELRLHARA
ncbi:MAG TPA: DUF711 family protein [Anaerolineae bacterium]|nr:DUF711 family protein [Anaerolineae bacterium]HQI84153.1 DUF711 family protein [Anaerolineae bacterium]